MARYAWIIVRDLLHEDCEKHGDCGGMLSAQGVTGPRDITDQQVQDLENPKVQKSTFRLRDDDGEVYAEGLFLGDSESEDAFGPLLEDYGTPNWGCTEIQYRRVRKWETL